MASRKTEFPRAVPSGDGESATTAPVQPGVVSPVYLGGATEGQRVVGEDVVVRGEIVKEVGLETKVVPVRARRSMEIDPAMDDELSMLAREIDSSLSRSTSCASMLFSEDEDFLERPRSRRKRRHSKSDEESSVVESDSQTSAKRKGKAGKAKAPSSAEQFRVALYEGGNTVPPKAIPPKATGRYAGLSQARADLAEYVDREMEKEAAEAVAGTSKPVTRHYNIFPVEEIKRADVVGAEMDECARNVLEAVKKSGHLKGTIIKAIKENITTIRRNTEWFVDRTNTAECADLRKDNARLEAELKERQIMMTGIREESVRSAVEMRALRKAVANAPNAKEVLELRAERENLERQVQSYVDETIDLKRRLLEQSVELRKLKNQLQELQASSVPQRAPGEATKDKTCAAPAPIQPVAASPDESLEARIVRQIGDIFNVRLAAIEERLAQPGKRKPARNAKAARSASQSAPRAPKAPTQSRDRATQPVPAGDPGTSRAPPPSASTTTEQWTTVVRRGKRRKKTPAKEAPASQAAQGKTAPATAPAPKPKKKRKRRFRLPRSQAVVITLQPGAEEKGITYATVFREAHSKLSPTELGITDARFRLGATGSRILEVPGADSGDKADLLANKLAEILPEGAVKISRPIKSAELRIRNLDDSATPAEVIAAVAREGGCDEALIKTGEIRRAPSGVGSIWVRCPVSAAKALSKAGRVKVGWVMARVQTLEPRPMRCYRCLLSGHVAQWCTASVDTSGGVLCFRCGKAGHKSAQCTAQSPACGFCAAEGRKSDHRVGSTAKCRPRKARAPARDSRVGGEAMDT
ncbi:uncharacterized protein LOC128202465 [Galleria mellonella]|uniref:Uncharacterized protein LOC128202465 n=1 Tax=Galleria mellonella TaxID=7137 RepID=A0ABM3N5L6_GALME|nr:uncharacterized protein LOC128202465 [Galleria mellonella]